MLLAWLVFPLVLAALSAGCGLLLERAAGIRLPGALVPAAGLAVIVVVAQLATLSDAIAELATPVVVGAAVAGVALSLPWRRGRLDPWAAAAAVAVFVVFGAPVLLSGDATFAGYIKLDDTATWLAMTDRVMEHGRSLDGLAPSTYEVTLANYLATGYPVGSFVPLGVGHELVGRDVAWLFQPYLAFLAAILSLCFYALGARLIDSRPLRAITAAIASQPALLFAYSLWGGVKELAAASVLALVAALVPPVLAEGAGLRALVPLAVASAAALGVLSIGGVVWLAPALLAAVATVAWLRGPLAGLRQTLAFLVLGAILALPTLVESDVFLKGGETLRSESELGNLIKPISSLQFFGIWPTGDFRVDPSELAATKFLIVVLVLAAVLGIAWAWRRRSVGLLLYIWTATAGCLAVTALGSPWVDAKAIATASPAFVLAGMVGAAALFDRGRRVEAAVIAAAIAGGVLWSNALAYHEVNLAPRQRLAEIERVSHQIAGEGPTLMTDYEPYGVRHLLREADAEGASELRRREVPLRSGRPLEKLAFADIDQFRLDGLLVYRTLVLRRSPVGSRPPSIYRLVSSGRFYEVWQRPDPLESPIVERLPLGGGHQVTGRARCADVRRLARVVGPNGFLAAMRRPDAAMLDLGQTALPAGWQRGEDGAAVLPKGDGELHAGIALPSPGRYGLWLGGAFRGHVEIEIDGRRFADERHELSHAGHFVPLGTPYLGAGSHALTLRYSDGGMRPGEKGESFPLGPIALASESIGDPILYVPVRDARTLCGRRLDWIEAVRS